MPDPIYYVWHPDFWPAVSALRRRFTIYHRYDKFDAYEGAHKARLQGLEMMLGIDADLLIASSRALAADFSEATGRPVAHLPHGVDLRHFEDRTRSHAVPDELAKIPKPRLGFVGKLNEAVDEILLSQIAMLRPDWSLVLIGPECHTSRDRRLAFQRLLSLPNVYGLGMKSRDAVPQYMAALDVGLLSYAVHNWTGWGQPIKAYEYLACGRPIVSAPIAAAEDFGDLVRVAKTPEEWVSAIIECLRAESPELARRRGDFARANTWERRVKELTHIIQDALLRRDAASALR
jgi:glycosyltransferase involved in cell wall biosynthesis